MADGYNIAARADYLFTTHLHTAHLASKYGDKAEEERQRTLSTTFLVLGDALRTHHADKGTVAALNDYMYTVGKCEYKNILGHGRPAHDDCAEHGFFMVDPRARTAMDEARAGINMTQYPTVSYWKPAAVARENGPDQ